jgi:hypothetical protein
MYLIRYYATRRELPATAQVTIDLRVSSVSRRRADERAASTPHAMSSLSASVPVRRAAVSSRLLQMFVGSDWAAARAETLE